MNIWNNFSPVHANFMILNVKWVTAELVRLNGWQDHSALNSLCCLIVFFTESLLERKLFQKHTFSHRYNLEVIPQLSQNSLSSCLCSLYLNCSFCHFCRKGSILRYCVCFYFMCVFFPKWSDLLVPQQSNLAFEYFVLGTPKKNHLKRKVDFK